MRIDKLTTKFQEALQDAQSVAAGRDHQYIEGVHVLLALIAQTDGAARSLLARAGVHVQALQAGLQEALGRLPEVKGNDGNLQVGRELTGLLNQSDKEAQKAGDSFISSECGSPISSAVTIAGPIGANVSKLLPSVHCDVASCTSRALTSLRIV